MRLTHHYRGDTTQLHPCSTFRRTSGSCPTIRASVMPADFDPEAPPPPVFLARMTGATAQGAFSSELYVPMCTRAPP